MNLTGGVFEDMMSRPDGGFDAMDPANISPLVVWLGSDDCDITGRTFENTAGQLNVCDGWQKGPVESVGDRRMTVAEAGELARRSVAGERPPQPVHGAQS